MSRESCNRYRDVTLTNVLNTAYAIVLEENALFGFLLARFSNPTAQFTETEEHIQW